MNLSSPSIFKKAICTIDFETTGLSSENGDRAIELGMVRMEPNGEIKKWANLIYPKMKIPSVSQNIHGINDQMVLRAPTFDQLYPQIFDFLEGAHLIAHNSKFDIAFLVKECTLAQCPVPQYDLVFDTLMFARHVFGLPRCNLTSISERFSVPVHNAHRALHDAFNTHLIFLKMVDALRESIGIQDARALKSLCDSAMNTKQAQQTQTADLNKAIEGQYCIELDYVSGDPSRKLIQRRIVQPIHFDGYRVLVFCHLRKAERSLRLNRILQILGPCSSPDEHPVQGQTI